jgi:glycosyltransferase involved in cell wall biosynthesis
VVTTTAGGVLAEPSGPDTGVPVLRLGRPARTRHRGPYRLIRGQALTATLRAYRADLVHAHVSAFSPLAWTAAALAASTGTPTVVSVHSMWHDVLPLVSRYARWQGAAGWPVMWAAVSTAAADAVREALDGTPVAVLPNGIDPELWHVPSRQVRPSWRVRQGVPTLISVMRMVHRKRPGALLDILLELQHRCPGRFRAVLVGDGPLLPRLRRKVETTRGAPGILFTGALDRPAIRHQFAAADLYVAPAPRESFGIAALEARSAGLPVLARAESGIADFVLPGVNGWLVGSDEDLTGAIADLLDDPARLDVVARHNRETSPPMHWPAVLASAQVLYDAAARRQAHRWSPHDMTLP